MTDFWRRGGAAGVLVGESGVEDPRVDSDDIEEDCADDCEDDELGGVDNAGSLAVLSAETEVAAIDSKMCWYARSALVVVMLAIYCAKSRAYAG
ncbi:hypothetical protein HOO65_010825 [Ceratocystis lukuohia]|uniref:Uncharacterized protein n=1 Tax=Ceratocystis lukuohia TaxID=2019550 RepID=A0ABR4MT66_9PEZI